MEKSKNQDYIKDLLNEINANLTGEELVYNERLAHRAAAGKVKISTIQKIDWTPVEYISIRGNGVAFRYENGNETIITTLQHIAIKVMD